MKFLHAMILFLLFAVVLPTSSPDAAAATAPLVVHAITVSAGANGKIYYGANEVTQPLSIALGKTITLKMVPDEHYRVQSVTVGDAPKGAVKTVRVKVAADVTAAATFEKIPYPITISSGKGGTISSEPKTTGTFGEEKTFTITRDEGYYLVDLKLDGKSIKDRVQNDSFSLTVAGNHKITATFSNLYTISASAGAGGTIAPKGNVRVKYGASKVFIPKAAKGYFVSDLLVDGATVGPDASYTFTPKWDATGASHTVAARFETIRHYEVSASATAGGSIVPEVASLASGETAEFTITPQEAYQLQDVLVDDVSVGAVTKYTLTMADKARKIQAVFTPVAFEITATPGAGGTISPAGTTYVAYKSSQTYTITPNAGYRIQDVTVGGVKKGPIGTWTYQSVTAADKIEATFIRVFSVSATAQAGGTISPSGAVGVDSGSSQTFTITPAAGYAIGDVVVNGKSVGAISTFDLGPVGEEGHSIVASFLKLYTITAEAAVGGTISPSGAVSVKEGGASSFTIVPNQGYRLGELLVDGKAVAPGGSYLFSNVRENGHTINATFVKTYPITSQFDPQQGSIAPSGAVVDAAGSATFTIAPADGYQIADVKIDGVSQGPLTSYTFTETAGDRIIEALFTKLVKITAGAGSGGSVTPAGSFLIPEGGSQSFTITPATGYGIAAVEVDGKDVGKVSSYTFTGVTEEGTLNATFFPLSYIIGATSGSGGTIDPSGSIAVTHGESRSFTITGMAGYHIKNVIVDGESVGAVGEYAFEAVDHSHSIEAVFEADLPVTYSVMAFEGEHGAISPAGISTVAAGGALTFTITPATGYHIVSVMVDGVSVGAVGSYTFTGLASNRTISATFEMNAPQMATITANAGQGGAISPSGVLTLPEGTAQNFLIIPLSGYHLATLTINGEAQAPETMVVLTAGVDSSIAATFEPDAAPSHVIEATVSGQGTVLPAAHSAVPEGSSLNLTFVPAEGYRVKEVSINGTSRGNITTHTFSAIGTSYFLTVEFEPISPATFAIAAAAGSGGIVAPPGRSTVAEGATPSFTLTPDTGYHLQAVEIDGIAVTPLPASPYVFEPVHADHVLTARFAPDTPVTHTIVASAGAGGSITPGTGATVADGGTKAFAITPDAGYRIARVEVGGVDVGAVPSYTFTDVRTDYSISAWFERFEPIPTAIHAITATAGTGGIVSPAGVVSVADGTTQTFSFIPNEGYNLTLVEVDGVAVPGSIATKEFTFIAVTADHTVSATFTPANPVFYTITAAISENQTGWGTITPSGGATVAAGYNKVYDIAAADGYVLIDVVVDGVSQGPVSSYAFMGVNTGHTITAVFSPVHVVRAEAGTGGYVYPAGVTMVREGASLTITMTPVEGYVIQKVEVTRNGVTENIGAVSTYTVSNVREPVFVYVSFLQSFTIEAAAGAGGSIMPSGKNTLLLGGTSTYTITPDPGYAITSVVIDDVERGALGSYKFANVYRDHSIRAEFAKLWSITASATGSGTITPAGKSLVVEGRSVTYTFTPAAGWYVQDVIVDGESKGGATSHTFTGVAADHTIAVRFGRAFSVTASAGAGGRISPSGTLLLTAGSSQDFTITANPGYTIQGVAVTRGGTTEQLGPVPSWTLPAIAENVTVEASFIAVYTIDATTVGYGTISPSWKKTYVAGSSQAFTITPTAGNYIVDVTVDGVSVGAVTSYTISNIGKAYTITATFAPIHTINASTSGGGSIEPAGAISVHHGASQKFTFTPPTGKVVKDVIIDGVRRGALADFTFADVSADHSIVVEFDQPQWKKVTLKLASASNDQSTVIQSLVVLINLPQGVSTISTVTGGDLFLYGVAKLTPATEGAPFVMGDYLPGNDGTGGQVRISITHLVGFTLGNFAELELDIATGSFPTANDFPVQFKRVNDKDEIYGIDGAHLTGVTVSGQATLW